MILRTIEHGKIKLVYKRLRANNCIDNKLQYFNEVGDAIVHHCIDFRWYSNIDTHNSIMLNI